jgi:signal transduction histidine kinase/CheY-like chemotaxis protein
MSEIIDGCVTDESPSGAYVQILTKGYNKKEGFIPSEEIPEPLFGEKKLYVGDFVKAVEIGTYKSHSKNEIYPKLSISKLVEKIQNGLVIHPLKGNNFELDIDFDHVRKTSNDQVEKWMKIKRFPSIKVRSILIVDDQNNLGGKTSKIIADMGYHVKLEEDPNKCFYTATAKAYDLILMDFTLGNSKNGFEEAKLILRAMSQLPPRIIIFSRDDPYNLIQKIEELSPQSQNTDKGDEFPLSQLGGIYCGSLEEKTLQKLIGLVEEGYYVSNLYGDGDQEKISEEWAKRIKNSFGSGVPISERIHNYLIKIKEKFDAQYVGVFRFDRVTKEVTLVDDINIDHDEYNSVRKNLRYSRISDVIEEGKVKYFHNIETWQMIDLFKHLLSLFGNWIRNFLGIPLIATGPTEHGLFMVNFKPKESMEKILDSVSNEAVMIASIIERNRYQEIIESEQRFTLIGKIRSTFVHELRAATDALFDELKKFKEEQDMNKGNEELLRYFNEMVPRIFEKKNKITEIFDTFIIFYRDTVQPCKLDEILNHVVKDLIWDKIQEREVKISRDYAKNIPKIKINQSRLQPEIVNLMSNAFDHMKNTPCKEVFLSTSFNCKSKDCFIEIRITDTACGIHHKDFDKIFEPFYTTKPGGTGLGLFISRALIGSMSGKLLVEKSWPYMGTTFLIKLPYIPAEG